jgi:hypothetical protein
LCAGKKLFELWACHDNSPLAGDSALPDGPDLSEHFENRVPQLAETQLDDRAFLKPRNLSSPAAVRMCLKLSRFPLRETLKECGAQPAIDSKVIQKFRTQRFIRSADDAVFFGPPASGRPGTRPRFPRSQESGGARLPARESTVFNGLKNLHVEQAGLEAGRDSR